MRGSRIALSGLLASLLLTPSVVPPAPAAPGTGAEAPRAAADTFEPTFGVTFNAPTGRRAARAILHQVVGSIRSTAAGEHIRITTWNFDDEPTSRALLDARDRGAVVQVVVPNRVDNDTWSALRRSLNRDGRPETFAVQCRGGCRSQTRIMHTKLFLFSRVGDDEQVSMVSSSNLTAAARNRQFNDLLTTKSPEVYDYLARLFDQYAQDKSRPSPYDAKTLGDHRIWVFPVGDRNPQLGQLKKVRCHGATGRTGTRDGRTRIRVSVAGWFDSYGEDIAKHLRVLWDRGCDVKVVTTLAGRGINRALKAGHGRGPVPMRRIAWDRNGDGLPDRYLHQKSVAISGVFGADTSASVVLTGSPNWSARAAQSEEIWVRVLDRRKITRQYLTRVDNLFRSPFSSSRLATRAELQRSLERRGRVSGQAQPPAWLELD